MAKDLLEELFGVEGAKTIYFGAKNPKLLPPHLIESNHLRKYQKNRRQYYSNKSTQTQGLVAVGLIVLFSFAAAGVIQYRLTNRFPFQDFFENNQAPYTTSIRK